MKDVVYLANSEPWGDGPGQNVNHGNLRIIYVLDQ